MKLFQSQYCCGLGYVGKHHTTTLSSPVGLGRELWETKAVLEVKQKPCMQAKQNKELIHYFPSPGRCASHFQEGRASACITLIWEDKCQNSISISSFFPQFCCWAQHCMMWNTPLVSLSQLAWLHLPRSLVHSQATCWQASIRNGKSLDAVEALLSNN